MVLPIESYDLKGTTNISVKKDDADILNESEFVKTLTDALHKKRFTMSAKGKTIGHLGALKAPLTLDKDVEMDGKLLQYTSELIVNDARARQFPRLLRQLGQIAYSQGGGRV